jgi:hypothetical protein
VQSRRYMSHQTPYPSACGFRMTERVIARTAKLDDAISWFRCLLVWTGGSSTRVSSPVPSGP